MCKRAMYLTACVMVLALTNTWADVAVPTMFTDHAVLQRNIQVPVWGTASAGEPVTVLFADQEKSATADGSGNWSVMLDAMSASTSWPTAPRRRGAPSYGR